MAFKIVGHRGYPEQFPENSSVGLCAAAKLGCEAVELDVQFSKDGVPMVFHDDELSRVCGQSGKISDFTASELCKISCHEPKRFGQKHLPTYISTLDAVCYSLKDFSAHVFIELKEHIFERFTREEAIEKILPLARRLKSASIISFDYDVLGLLKGRAEIGWVLRNMDAQSLEKAKVLQPAVLAYDVKKLNETSTLWAGNWQWFLYDIIDPKIAEFWASKGVIYVESWDPAALM